MRKRRADSEMKAAEGVARTTLQDNPQYHDLQQEVMSKRRADRSRKQLKGHESGSYN